MDPTGRDLSHKPCYVPTIPPILEPDPWELLLNPLEPLPPVAPEPPVP